MDVPETRDWLIQHSGLDGIAQEALLAPETRPRCTEHGDGVILNLRGVNLNPGADPEDMVSIRIWIDAHRLISVRLRRLMAVEDLRQSIDAGRVPKTTAGLVSALAKRLTQRMTPVVSDIDEAVDTLDEELVEGGEDLSEQLGVLRRQIVMLRRYVAPQRDALRTLASIDAGWIGQRHRQQLREVGEQVTRLVEELDQARERAGLVSDELTVRLSAQMSRTTYLLSVVAGIFLPLGFVTGLLGINVGGIPGAATPWAFSAVAVGLVAVGVVGAWVFRRLKWI